MSTSTVLIKIRRKLLSFKTVIYPEASEARIDTYRPKLNKFVLICHITKHCSYSVL